MGSVFQRAVRAVAMGSLSDIDGEAQVTGTTTQSVCSSSRRFPLTNYFGQNGCNMGKLTALAYNCQPLILKTGFTTIKPTSSFKKSERQWPRLYLHL